MEWSRAPRPDQKATRSLHEDRSSRFCARWATGSRRMNAVSPVITGRASPSESASSGGWERRGPRLIMASPLRHCASVRRHFRHWPAATNKEASRPLKRLDGQVSCGGALIAPLTDLKHFCASTVFRLSPVRWTPQRDLNISLCAIKNNPNVLFCVCPCKTALPREVCDKARTRFGFRPRSQYITTWYRHGP